MHTRTLLYTYPYLNGTVKSAFERKHTIQKQNAIEMVVHHRNVALVHSQTYTCCKYDCREINAKKTLKFNNKRFGFGIGII